MVRFQARTRICPLAIGCAALFAGCAPMEQGDASSVQAALESEHDHEQAAEASPELTARAILRDANGDEVGTIRFRPAGHGAWVSVQAHVDPGASAIRGMHVHANDNPDNGVGCIADPTQPASTHFVSADGHFSPTASTHGHHAGDMPALFFTTDGDAALQFLTDHFSVNDVLGRAVILHAGADNYGNIPVGDKPEEYKPNDPAATDLTAKTGNAGARFACGVIERAAEE